MQYLDHKSLNALHRNVLPVRSYYVPFESEEKALEGKRENSAFFRSLCGEWGFQWFPSEEELPDVSDLSFTPAETIPVPSCWQTFVTRGYDVPNYTNIKYPFPVDPQAAGGNTHGDGEPFPVRLMAKNETVVVPGVLRVGRK
ncbi:MAG: hypothetical protein ILO68_02355, partial [Clostridia bacterium]|nr:hypothetical protein [Clostridia bacterium]